MMTNNIIQTLISKIDLHSDMRFYHGCCVTNSTSDNVLTTGFNSYRESRQGANYCRHAEVDATGKLESLGSMHTYNCKRKRKINLYVVRINKLGEFKNSKPCFKCIDSLARLRHYKVYYVLLL